MTFYLADGPEMYGKIGMADGAPMPGFHQTYHFLGILL
jgi:hypothetical protein